MSDLQNKAQELLALADVKINGSRPWDIQVHNDNFYDRVLAEGSLGFGESYMEGWWDCDQLDVMIDKLFKAQLNKKIITPIMVFSAVKAKLLNMQTKSKSMVVQSSITILVMIFIQLC